MMPKPIRYSILFFAIVATLVAPVTGFAQDKFPPIQGLKGLGEFKAPGETKLKVSARILLDENKQNGAIQIIAEVPKDWHIFSVTQKPGGPTRTEFELSSAVPVQIGPFKPDHKPQTQKSEFFPVTEEYHEGRVVWTAPIGLESIDDPQQLVITGKVKGQICSASSCVPLETMDTSFTAKVDPNEVYDPSQVDEAEDEGSTREGAAGFSLGLLLKNMGLGVVGGLILNLMPCVLPVIGLKLMSFVQQSQGSRWEALKLNIVFSIGILVVFLGLATLAVTLNLGWGEQFTNTPFKVSMVVLVFAMALSFLGVWEIPIPGFVGRGRSQELASKEGVSGAFFKGVFTTVLATPCSGPFLGPVFAYTAKQAPLITYAIMMSVGLGLALPYLLIGAFPALMRWIPKPGAWMDTFKQLMGFVLLGTTVYLVSTINESLFIPTLTLMFGVWFGCWWIGRIPVTASFDRKLAGWIGGIATSAAIGFVAFNYLGGHSYLNWSPYSEAALANASQEGKTVLVDFTADWCLTCQVNSAFAIDTRRVGEAVKELGIVPLLADWTDKSTEIKEKLAELNSESIPLLAIYPAGAPDDPIVLRDVVTERQVLDALKQAGPSLNTELRTATGTGGGDGDLSGTMNTQSSGVSF